MARPGESGAVASPILRAEKVSKSFGSTRALRGASLALGRSQIHGLIGGNGSGKSTLIKVLAGVHAADEGHIEVNGVTFDARSFTASDAHSAGLRFVHQQPSVFRDMTVAENLAADRGFARGVAGRIKWRDVNAHAAKVLERFEIGLRPKDELLTASPALQMMVAVARALQDQEGTEDGILVLDEATAALTGPEVDLLTQALRRYAAQGQTIMVVTHRVEELVGFADRITALRDGAVVAAVDAGPLTHENIVDLIVGPDGLSDDAGEPDAVIGRASDPALSVRGLSVGRVRDLDFDAYAGEVLGFAGTVGSGRTTLLRTIFGQQQRQAGSIDLDGKPLDVNSATQAITRGVAYLPEDRGGLASFPDMTVAENLSASVVGSYWGGMRLRSRKERRDATDLMRQYRIHASGPDALLSTLSGGNQQKVMIARWMRRKPRILMLDDPTQGVDVGARREIYKLIRRAASEGAAVLLASSDFEELAELSTRVLVLVNGRLGASFGTDCDSERLHRAALAGTGEK
ncbi:MAG TPA: sugar ABC transporter ATP-binding protein [Solirubrobacterales bacterium]|nr:sugar ABC transporter ATP-binding protein [Solirubrobacterales bacterium]